ncbi:MAG: alpha/beta fold hydrolase [Sandaracinaceae bacterium]
MSSVRSYGFPIARALALSVLFAGCAAEGPAGETSAELRDAELPYVKTVQLPNLFGVPGYESLDIPIYESPGTRGPGILLVHGNSASSRAYVRQVFSLYGRTHKMYLLDLPGYGQSGRVDPSRPFPVDPATGLPVGFAEYQLGLIEAVATVANDPDLAPQIFVGWSLGGDVLLIAQGAGLLPNARGLFLFGTAPAGASPPSAEHPFDGPDVPGLPLSVLASFGFAFQPNPASPLGFSLDGQFPDPPPPYAAPPTSDAPTVGDAYVRGFFNEVRRTHPVLVPDAFLEDGFDADWRARGSLGVIGLGLGMGAPLPDELDVLRGLAGDPSDPSDDIPVAVLVGEEDAFVNTQYLEDLRTTGGLPTLWNDTIIEVPHAGHAIQWERPVVFNALLADFVYDVTH